MIFHFRITRALLLQVHADLSRPHSHAGERVAFISCRPAPLMNGAMEILAADFHPVADDDYERDATVGAMLGAGAFRKSLQIAYNAPLSMFHAHRHEHYGRPRFSKVDLLEAHKYVPDFSKVRPGFPHGILVLSHDSASGLAWNPNTRSPVEIACIRVIGSPIHEIHGE